METLFFYENPILEISRWEYIRILYPDKITREAEYHFLHNDSLRSKIVKVTLNLLGIIGYVMDKEKMILQKKSNRKKSLMDLSRMSTFLERINLPILSSAIKRIQGEGNDYDDETPDVVFLKPLGLSYIRNSCYQDVILTILLSPECNLLQKKGKIENEELRSTLLDLQSELYESKHANPRVTCASLKDLESVKEDFSKNGMQDAGEFCRYIIDSLGIHTTQRTYKIYVTNNMSPNPKKGLKVNEYTHDSSPIVIVHPDQKADHLDLEDFLIHKEDGKLSDPYKTKDGDYSRRIEFSEITRADYLIFNVQRLHLHRGGISRSYTPVKIEEYILGLKLRAIVVHQDHHYTCYLSHKGIWYHYDDNPGGDIFEMEKIGSFQDMIRSNPNPQTLGTLYFYG